MELLPQPAGFPFYISELFAVGKCRIGRRMGLFIFALYLPSRLPPAPGTASSAPPRSPVQAGPRQSRRFSARHGRSRGGAAQLRRHGRGVVEVCQGALRIQRPRVQDALRGLLDQRLLLIGGGRPGEVVVDDVY